MGQVIKGWTEAMQLMVEGARGFDKPGLAALRGKFFGYNPYRIHGTIVYLTTFLVDLYGEPTFG